ncbi:MAG: nucleotide exchange factor GrpE [Candidatus Schekmanbacteria bacterium GWA2_38_11]|uniref:Protein GrpE n=1 Tax=Candidatus Schekmanbacteria bacterium GWA2_38_11 TaxID=1817876 RepID=A0A1F7RB31_9BACT|nr:MAG: nucleotide exchange factor GrpE [Candidatus Schekmanbacteria bacterium GWA2_38_11]
MEEKDNERQVKESGPGFKVIDKRHSVKKVAEGEKGDDIQSKKYPSYVEELRSELDKKDKILKEYIESYKNMKKENEDFRNRLKKDMELRLESAKMDFIKNFIEVFDNLNRALDAAEDSKNIVALIDGVRMIQSQFFTKLKKDGIVEIDPIGKPFDPRTQEAVETVEVGEKEKDNIVLSQCEKGYLMGERLLRPAKVRVGRIKDEAREIA